MKNIQLYILIAIIAIIQLVPLTSKCQSFLDGYFEIFDQIETETGFLLNRSFLFESEVEPFLLSDDIPTLSDRRVFSSPFEWRKLYRDLETAEINTPKSLLPYSFYPDLSENESTVYLGIIYMDADYLIIDSLPNYIHPVDSFILPDAPKKIVNIATVSNLKNVVPSKEVDFVIDTTLLFTNKDEKITGIEIDFGDGSGSQYFSLNDRTIRVDYPSAGEKSIIYKLITDSYNELVTFSNLIIENEEIANTPSQYVTTNLPNGQISGAYYSTFLGCDNVLDKPIIIVEGFDPYAMRDLNKARKVLLDKYRNTDDNSALYSHLINRGYDIITVVFENNSDDIHNNALVLQEVIREINNNKVGFYESIIIGQSMGGIITRIALKTFENNNEEHYVRLYVSFDSPHKGANLPISLQELLKDATDMDTTFLYKILSPIIFNTFGGGAFGSIGGGIGTGISVLSNFVIGDIAQYLIEENIDEQLPEDQRPSDKKVSLDDLVKANESKAALQLLIRTNTEKQSKNTVHERFQSELNIIGFPERCRNISLFNGSNTAKPSGIEFTDKYLDTLENRKFGIGYSVFAKVSQTNKENFKGSQIKATGLWIPVVHETGKFTFFDKPYDLAPGGNVGKGLTKAIPFVPTSSAIALNTDLITGKDWLFYHDETDLSRNKKALVSSNLVPFDDMYGQSENTPHGSLNSLNGLVNKFFDREFMTDTLDLQNRMIRNNQARDFEATNIVSIGRNVNHWSSSDDEKLFAEGDFVMANNSKTRIKSGGSIEFQAGTEIEVGAYLETEITPSYCRDYRSKSNSNFNKIIANPIFNVQVKNSNLVECSLINKSPFANAKDYEWSIHGLDFHQDGIGESFSIEDAPSGQYLIQCSLFDQSRTSAKIIRIQDKITVLSSNDYEPIELDTKEIRFMVYPNPTSNHIYIQSPNKWNNNVNILITDVNGKVVHRNEKVELSNGSNTNIDVSSLPSGFYFVQISADTGIQEVHKITVF